MTNIHSCSYYCDRPECIKAQRDELRDKLAQPEQEPVAWATMLGNYSHVSWGKDRPDYPIRYEIPLYTTPQQRKPLSDEQWQVMADTLHCAITRRQKNIIESVLGIKE